MKVLQGILKYRLDLIRPTAAESLIFLKMGGANTKHALLSLSFVSFIFVSNYFHQWILGFFRRRLHHYIASQAPPHLNNMSIT